jgi:hypothetical protein
MAINISELYHGEFMNAADLAGRGEVKARITTARLVEVYNQEKREMVSKLGLGLQGWPRMMVVSTTNARLIAQALGDDAEKWVGGELAIYAGKMRGKDCILVRAARRPAPAAKQAAPAASKVDESTGEITGTDAEGQTAMLTVPTIEDLKTRTPAPKCAIMCQEWASALAELSDTCPYWRASDNQPNGAHALRAAAKFGHAQITSANVMQVVTDLRVYGAFKLAEQDAAQAAA